MKSIAFFNNKGGVGKTTLCCNIASFLASQRKCNILLIDCDPQCNSTQLILGEQRCEDLYYSATRRFKADTVLTVLKPLLDGDSSINRDITPIDAKHNRFDIDLLPGHPDLAMMEDALSDAWSKGSAGKIEGLRRTHWATSLLHTFKRYDLIIFDVGPSLGALNRSVLIGAQSFVTPMGCDIFSIVGIRNIAKWLKSWLKTYAASYTLSAEDRRDALAEYLIPELLPIERGFIGYTVQQYITKSKEGVRRPTSAYERIIQQMPGEITSTLLQFAGATVRTAEDAKLGDVPHLFSLVPLAQANNAPVHGLQSSDGLVGTQYSQARRYSELIGSVADKLWNNLGVSGTRS